MIWRGDREVWFSPVARIDTGQPKGFLPYSGSDTGGLIAQGVPGYVCGRDPTALADVIRAARHLDRTKIADAVAALSAPRVVQEVFFPPSLEATVELPTGGVR